MDFKYGNVSGAKRYCGEVVIFVIAFTWIYVMAEINLPSTIRGLLGVSVDFILEAREHRLEILALFLDKFRHSFATKNDFYIRNWCVLLHELCLQPS